MTPGVHGVSCPLVDMAECSLYEKILVLTPVRTCSEYRVTCAFQQLSRLWK
jgi:hypothetical protein